MKKVKAKFKYVRISPTKLRRTVNLVRGKDCNSSMALLKTIPHRGGEIVHKIVLSAVSNAKNNHQLDPNNLKIVEISVDSAGMLKRFRAKSRGRAGRINKRISHINITVEG
ncbi:50S ribosomal protein L22 [Candidatus Margulisiibacteriota bacterium]